VTPRERRRVWRHGPAIALALAGLVTVIAAGISEEAIGAMLGWLGSAAPRWSPADLTKLRLVLRLYAVAAFGLSTITVLRVSHPAASRRVGGMGIAMLVLLIVLGFRAGSGVGLGLTQLPGGDVASGILLNPTDNLSYMSWARQAEQGTFFFRNLYTTAPHEPAAINAYLWLVGAFARLFQTDLSLVYHALGLLAAAVAILATYAAALVLGLGHRVAWWAALVLSFASGFGLPARVLAALLRQPEPPSSDVEFTDAGGFTVFFGLPYHSAMLAAVALLILAVAIAERRIARRSPPRSATLLAILATSALLAASRPYDAVMLVGSYSVFALLEGSSRRLRLSSIAALWGGAALPLAWAVHVAALPVWANFAASSIVQARGRLFWALGFGLLLPLALYGANRVLRQRRLIVMRWLVIWVVAVLAALTVIGVPYSKVVSGLAIPLSLLVGLGIVRGVKWAHLALGRGHGLAGAAIAIAAIALLFGTPFYLLQEWIGPHRISAPLVQIAAELRDAPRPVRLLAPPEVAEIVVPFVGASTYIGHWSLTPDYEQKLARLGAAGVLPGGDASTVELVGLLRECQCSYLVLSSTAGRAATLASIGATGISGDWPAWVLASVDGDAESP